MFDELPQRSEVEEFHHASLYLKQALALEAPYGSGGGAHLSEGAEDQPNGVLDLSIRIERDGADGIIDETYRQR